MTFSKQILGSSLSLLAYGREGQGQHLLFKRRISQSEIRRQEFCLLIFILFGSIAIKVITLYTTILSKLYLYDKWKNNQ